MNFPKSFVGPATSIGVSPTSIARRPRSSGFFGSSMIANATSAAPWMKSCATPPRSCVRRRASCAAPPTSCVRRGASCATASTSCVRCARLFVAGGMSSTGRAECIAALTSWGVASLSSCTVGPSAGAGLPGRALRWVNCTPSGGGPLPPLQDSPAGSRGAAASTPRTAGPRRETEGGGVDATQTHRRVAETAEAVRATATL